MRRPVRTVLLPAVLTVLAVASLFFPSIALTDGSIPAWLPSLGPPAVTTTAYRETALALGRVAVLAGAFALGYREASHHDVGRTYLRYVGVVYAAGATALLLTVVGVVVASGSAGSSPFLSVLVVAALLVAVPGVLTVSALAGVALASARGGDQRTPSTRELLPFALAASVVTGVGYALDSAGDLAMAAGDSVGVPTWLPQFGTIGSTVTTYFQAGQLAGDLALVGGGLALGALAVRWTGVAAASRRFVAAIATGALGGLLVAWVAVTWYLASANAGPDAPTFASIAAALPNTVVSTVVVVTLATIAGVGVARFEADGPDAGGSADSDDRDVEAVTETPVSEGSIRDH
ncbi:hypothetical protein [Halosimplex salinum]|uniref:hypothetical protein n=1 Tax=Halosimplex salinum TaxID=1710538 RepID=UPI000F46187E|nr:hypothetical protein [Halosimplex salinum]